MLTLQADLETLRSTTAADQLPRRRNADVDSRCHHDPVRAAEAVIDRVGARDLVMAIPIGIGKPILLVNALYDLAQADRRLSLKIFTGLTLARPVYRSSLERRFIELILDRVLPHCPELRYVQALRSGSLPANIQVHEFFLQAGAWLGCSLPQQNYISLNYTHVAEHLSRIGTNVLAQLVAPDPAGQARVSLSSNTDVTLDILAYAAARRRSRQPIVIAGELNANLPYMPGDAEIARKDLDVILEPERPHFDLFAPPKEPVSFTDYAMALHVAPHIKDGGTLQIGISCFADALTHIVVLRHTRNPAFRELVDKRAPHCLRRPTSLHLRPASMAARRCWGTGSWRFEGQASCAALSRQACRRTCRRHRPKRRPMLRPVTGLCCTPASFSAIKPSTESSAGFPAANSRRFA